MNKKVQNEYIEKTFDTKVKFGFVEAVGRQQIKAIVTNFTLDIIKDDEYVQKSGAEYFYK